MYFVFFYHFFTIYLLKWQRATVSRTSSSSANLNRRRLVRRAMSSSDTWGGRVVRWSWVKLPVLGRPTIRMIVGQGPIALAVGADGYGCLDIFALRYLFFLSLSLSLSGRQPDID